MTVTIGANTYDIYGSAAGLAVYAGGSLVFSAVHAAADAATLALALVESTRLLDRQGWAGAKTDPGQPLAWPRAGVVDAAGQPVDDAAVPVDIVTACYELALAGVVDATALSGPGTASNVQTATAGSASVTFFAPVTGTRFPPRVMELIGWALGGGTSSDGSSLGGSGAAGSLAAGFDGCSAFDRDDTYGRSIP